MGEAKPSRPVDRHSPTQALPLVDELDIYRTANVLVREHGADAPIHAAMRADVLLEAGDVDGCAVFKRVLRAVEELRRMEPAAGTPVQ